MHFAGHGDENGDFAFQDKDGNTKVVKASALGDILEMATTIGLRLVVLNSCYSDENAQYIAEKVGMVVAMRGAIQDDAAVAFTSELYGALGDSRDFSLNDVQTAFNWAHSGLRLGFDEVSAKPRLFLRQRNLSRSDNSTPAQNNSFGSSNPASAGAANLTLNSFSGNNYSGMQIGQNSGTAYIKN